MDLVCLTWILAWVHPHPSPYLLWPHSVIGFRLPQQHTNRQLQTTETDSLSQFWSQGVSGSVLLAGSEEASFPAPSSFQWWCNPSILCLQQHLLPFVSLHRALLCVCVYVSNFQFVLLQMIVHTGEGCDLGFTGIKKTGASGQGEPGCCLQLQPWLENL